MTLALLTILLPVLGGALAFGAPSNRERPWALPIIAIVHLGLTLAVLSSQAGGNRWLALDPPGKVVLLLISVLFAGCSVYAVGYLRVREDRPNRIFCACLCFYLGMMSFITWSAHLGLMWVAVEATTLSSAPLLYFNHNARSLEATWKFLVIGSVGIALALLGSFLLGYSSLAGGQEPSLLFSDLARNAPGFSKVWLRAAFVLLLVGYGTKMGLAPMHTWKPDAYGEAPGMVGALLAGGMTSCAFLALCRIHRIMIGAGEGPFAGRLLVLMGLLSMAVAGVFLVRQRDFKRMLAYSSVEHVGILILGLGLGGLGVLGALLHMVNNGLVKGVMFLAAGNIHRAYGSKSTEGVTGALRRLPISGALLLAGFFALSGSPPFGPFVSEFTIVNAMFGSGRYAFGGLFLLLLMVVFIGMGATVLHVVQGEPTADLPAAPTREGSLMSVPALALFGLVLMLGLFIPHPLRVMLDDAARYLGGTP